MFIQEKTFSIYSLKFSCTSQFTIFEKSNNSLFCTFKQFVIEVECFVLTSTYDCMLTFAKRLHNGLLN